MSTFYVFNEKMLEEAVDKWLAERVSGAPSDKEYARKVILGFLKSPEAAKLRGESPKS